ncbi:MAG: sugar ABC transporter ATP-binding protein [Deltaproteobacteria bacterium]|nr:sugar ABC transporter ATP-binding protein [Deltaproteobacteria bacterium]
MLSQTPNGAPILLTASNVGKSFGTVRVLDGVPFELRSGEVHVLAGENGAGKSTLIKILAGICSDFDGTVDARGNHVSVIHQELSLIDSMSAEDNIFLGREPSRGPLLDRCTQRARAAEICGQLELEIDLNEPVENFAMSVKNRIEIAKALSLDARIIIMDEPTSALTKPECENFFELIEMLKASGCGIIYISHKMDEIYRLADRITVLRDGKWIGTANAAELSQGAFVHWMIGRELVEQFPARNPSLGEIRLSLKDFGVPGLVENFTLDARAGEIIGIAGLQGSGSSELFNGLFGAYGSNVRGEVKIDGEEFVVRSPRTSIAGQMAYVTNDRKDTGLVLGMNIAKNISLASLAGVSPYGWMSTHTETEKARAHGTSLRIRASGVEQTVGELSGGNQQKVVLAKWLETKPKILLLDEPTRGVDVGAKHEIYELMNRLTRQGITILMISTEMPELLAMSDRIMVLHRGQITAELPRAQATQEKILRAAMGEVAA